MSGLTENNWILKSVSAFNPLQYHKSCGLLKTPLYTHKRMKMKKASHILVLLWKQFWPHRPLGAPQWHFENDCTSQMLWVHFLLRDKETETERGRYVIYQRSHRKRKGRRQNVNLGFLTSSWVLLASDYMCFHVYSSFCLIWVLLSKKHNYEMQWSWVRQVFNLHGLNSMHPAPIPTITEREREF